VSKFTLGSVSSVHTHTLSMIMEVFQTGLLPTVLFSVERANVE